MQWENAFQKKPDQWTRQLINGQMLAITKHNQGPLQKRLFNALMRMMRKNNRGSPNLPIDFMDRIEEGFEKQGLIKLRKNQKHYLVTIHGSKTAWLKHQQLLEIEPSPPAEQSDKAIVLKGYDSDTWDFFEDANIPLHESQ